MANSSASAQLREFNAHAIVDQEVNYTVIGGHFSPTIGIDLINRVVILLVVGSNDFRLSLSAGAFRKTALGGYVARVICGLARIDILLQPFSGGDWAYSAGINGFVPGSTPITVHLTIGDQAGWATVNVYSF